MNVKHQKRLKSLLGFTLLSCLGFALTFCAKENLDPTSTGMPESSMRIHFSDSSCYFTGDSIQPMHFTLGDTAINYIVVDGIPRKFIVYVPPTYDTTGALYPLVLMLHGTSQTANRMVIATTWRTQADNENLIIAYPESESYLIGGVPKTKWATDGTAMLIDPGQTMADDVKFIREMNKTIASHLFVNCRRVYACGFSNGGSFVKTKLRVETDQMFAATASFGGLGLRLPYHPVNGNYRPHHEAVGNEDNNKVFNCQFLGETFLKLPRIVDTIVVTPCMWDPINELRRSMELDSVFTYIEQPNYTEILFQSSLVGQNTEYRLRILRGLGHEIPGPFNGFSPDYIPILWNWMAPYSN